ncbi:hypothetical protein COY93_01025 [Candidatus Uhrbacteria bacterium CG_4_10_14_0_8_um_filter_58_22]|uniref:HEPN domain-containing protein n=1 Tax=Candidatus Uhrbacteria bacterium CG_4_10_14_0_8_um_filter_58_22 TaxID=1975029 RepID=A0A2M7QAS5_9BACT|nr:MAG: hypothetical protein COY93_01025 [Candidatus Uhrbacteria bacterium CG_4_10_14_0_8_um_filter_58_22]
MSIGLIDQPTIPAQLEAAEEMLRESKTYLGNGDGIGAMHCLHQAEIHIKKTRMIAGAQADDLTGVIDLKAQIQDQWLRLGWKLRLLAWLLA